MGEFDWTDLSTWCIKGHCIKSPSTAPPTPNVTSSTSTVAPPPSAWFYLMIGFIVCLLVLGAAAGGYYLYLKYWPKSGDDDGGDDEDGDSGKKNGAGKGAKSDASGVKSTAFQNSPLDMKSSSDSRADMSWPPPSSQISSSRSKTTGDSMFGSQGTASAATPTPSPTVGAKSSMGLKSPGSKK